MENLMVGFMLGSLVWIVTCIIIFVSTGKRLNDLERFEKYSDRTTDETRDALHALMRHFGLTFRRVEVVKDEEYPEVKIERLKAEEAQVDLDIKKATLEEIKARTPGRGK